MWYSQDRTGDLLMPRNPPQFGDFTSQMLYHWAIRAAPEAWCRGSRFSTKWQMLEYTNMPLLCQAIGKWEHFALFVVQWYTFSYSGVDWSDNLVWYNFEKSKCVRKFWRWASSKKIHEGGTVWDQTVTGVSFVSQSCNLRYIVTLRTQEKSKERGPSFLVDWCGEEEWRSELHKNKRRRHHCLVNLSFVVLLLFFACFFLSRARRRSRSGEDFAKIKTSSSHKIYCSFHKALWPFIAFQRTLANTQWW